MGVLCHEATSWGMIHHRLSRSALPTRWGSGNSNSKSTSIQCCCCCCLPPKMLLLVLLLLLLMMSRTMMILLYSSMLSAVSTVLYRIYVAYCMLIYCYCYLLSHISTSSRLIGWLHMVGPTVSFVIYCFHLLFSASTGSRMDGLLLLLLFYVCYYYYYYYCY